MKKPQKIILFNLDGILEIFLSLDDSMQKILSNSIRNVFQSLDIESQRKMTLLTPEMAKKVIGF